MLNDIKSSHPDWYALLSGADHADVIAYHDISVAAMSGNETARKALQSAFGCDGSVLDTYLIMSACSELMTDAEVEISARGAERDLDLIAHSDAAAQSVGARLTGKTATPLRVLRLQQHLTQRELSERSGVSIPQIQRVENGTAQIGNLTLRNAVALADALGVDAKDLL